MIKSIFNSFKVAFAMYSRIPLGNVSWDENNMRYSMCFVPCIGMIIGMLEFCWYLLYIKTGFNVVFYSMIATVIPVIITGGIHMDGYIDVIDAMSSFGSDKKRLEILKDPHVGAFAIIWTVVYFLLICGAFSCVHSYEMILCVGFGYVLSRSISCLMAVNLKNAKKEGTLYTFSTNQDKILVTTILWIETILCAVGICSISLWNGIIVLLVNTILIYYFLRKVTKSFGGITGDLAGYLVTMCELVTILGIVIGEIIWCFI